jgi:hypothetical protein
VNKAHLAAIAALLVSLHAGAAPEAAKAIALPAGVVKPGFFDAHGIRVLNWQRGVGGLNVWQVERNGMQTVLYSTQDNKTLISGVLWDAATGGVQSDAYITPAMTSPENVARINGASAVMQAAGDVGAPAAQAALPRSASQQGEAQSIAGVASLAGIKEGRASVGKTIYIMFDPRCPHCRNVFDQSRDFVAHGGTIKWLPVTVLGNQADGLNRVAAILQAKDPALAMKVVEHSAMVGQQQVSPSTVSAVSANEAYFWAAFTRNPGAGTPAVPVAFFQDRSGAPQMVSDLDDPALLKRIFEEVSK